MTIDDWKWSTCVLTLVCLLPFQWANAGDGVDDKDIPKPLMKHVTAVRKTMDVMAACEKEYYRTFSSSARGKYEKALKARSKYLKALEKVVDQHTAPLSRKAAPLSKKFDRLNSTIERTEDDAKIEKLNKEMDKLQAQMTKYGEAVRRYRVPLTTFLHYIEEDEELMDFHPLLGRKAPVVRVKDMNGERFVHADHFEGNWVFVYFWRSDVLADVELLSAIHGVTKSVAGTYDIKTKLLTVNVDEKTKVGRVKGALEDEKVDVPVLVDEKGKIMKAYKADRERALFVFDDQGILRRRFRHVRSASSVDSFIGLLLGKDEKADD